MIILDRYDLLKLIVHLQPKYEEIKIFERNGLGTYRDIYECKFHWEVDKLKLLKTRQLETLFSHLILETESISHLDKVFNSDTNN